jgi:enoyl-CoA hydratase
MPREAESKVLESEQDKKGCILVQTENAKQAVAVCCVKVCNQAARRIRRGSCSMQVRHQKENRERISMSFIELEKKGAYALVKINRPDALNALNDDVLRDLRAAINDLSSDRAIRGVILTGAGEKAFCAGADIVKMKDFSSDDAEEFARRGHKTMNMIANSDLLSIAAINGFALGGGMELALACDIRIASKNAKLALPETGLGILPGFGGTQRLPRIAGMGNALEMILTGEQIDATRALEMRLVNRVVEQAELLPLAESLMQKMLEKGPEAQKQARWLVHSGMEQPLTAALEREIIVFSELFSGKEPSVGLSAFVEKKKPQF